MTRVLVTGATGFIGSALVPRLVQAGYVPRLLARRSPSPVPPPPVEVSAHPPAAEPPAVAAIAGIPATAVSALAASPGQ